MMLVQERFFRRNFPFNTPVLQIKDAQEFGSEEQLRKVTEALKTKAMAFSLGISEPGAGSDSTCIASTATRRDGKVYLNGTKTSSLMPPIALHPVCDTRSRQPEPLRRHDHVVR